jgi:hypothetical protein
MMHIYLEVGMRDKLIEKCLKGASSIAQPSRRFCLCSTKVDSQTHSQQPAKCLCSHTFILGSYVTLLFSLKCKNASSLADMVTLLTYTQEVATSNLNKDINSPEIFLCPRSTVKLQSLTDVFYMKLYFRHLS